MQELPPTRGQLHKNRPNYKKFPCKIVYCGAKAKWAFSLLATDNSHTCTI